MIHVLFGMAVAALVMASPSVSRFVSRRLRRVMQVTGAAVVPPVDCDPAGGTAVPEARPRMTEPYAYDDGVMTGEQS